MRVLVTGASGFIGQALCRALGAARHEAVPCNVRHEVSLARADAVVHLAGIAHRRGVGADDYRRVNVELAANVGRAAAALGLRMIHMSSVKVHGDESAAPLAERSPFAPADEYARSKVRAEEALRAIAGLDLAVLRPPLVYGPGVRANFRALLRAVASGLPLPLAGIENRRSFVYVANLCDAVLRLLRAPHGATYLVSDGEALSTPELCTRLAAALDVRARLFTVPKMLLPPALTRSLEVDDRALRNELGWRPPFSVDEGLAATAQVKR
jgi:nucleoside-diphosphate-sugar epimerase